MLSWSCGDLLATILLSPSGNRIVVSVYVEPNQVPSYARAKSSEAGFLRAHQEIPHLRSERQKLKNKMPDVDLAIENPALRLFLQRT
jgi:hypothetical protein